LRRPLVLLVLLGTMTTALAELAARVITTHTENGMPIVGSVPLLPLRPSPALLRTRLASYAHSSYLVRDRLLGWTVRPGGRTEPGRVIYSADARGARTGQEPVESSAGTLRIATFGDSFTHCDEVADDATWQHYLQAAQAGLEVLNFGVPGYGTDQAFLRWRRHRGSLDARIVILGIWPENICRNVNIVRYYLAPSGGFSSKPRFVRDGAGMRLLNSPILPDDELIALLSAPEASALLEHDLWYRPADCAVSVFYGARAWRLAASVASKVWRYRARQALYSGEAPEGIAITVAIARQFSSEVRESGAIPLVLLIPMRDLLEQRVAPQPLPLVSALRAAAVDVIDLGPTFGRAILEHGLEGIYQPQGHHSARGNELLALHLRRALQPWIARARAGARPR